MNKPESMKSLDIGLKTAALLFLGATLVSGCGSSKNDPASSPQPQSKTGPSTKVSTPSASDNQATPAFTYHFKITTAPACRTGRKTGKDLPDFCTLLMNETANNHCAQDLRKGLFDQYCAANGFSWAPVEGDKEQGTIRHKKPGSKKPGTKRPGADSHEEAKVPAAGQDKNIPTAPGTPATPVAVPAPTDVAPSNPGTPETGTPPAPGLPKFPHSQDEKTSASLEPNSTNSDTASVDEDDDDGSED